MMIKHETKAPFGASANAAITLQDVLNAVERGEGVSVTRRRDLRSAVNRMASLLGDDPARIRFDLPAISAKLANLSPVAAGLTSKSFTNIKSDFTAAVKASGFKQVQRSAKTPLSTDWKQLIAGLSSRRARIGLSRLARYATTLGIAPEQINNAVIESFIAAVREGSLHRKPNTLHRTVALVWNKVARQPELNLQPVTAPSFRRPVKRVDWILLPVTFRNDVDAYETWCSGRDSFAADARSRALAPQTLKLRKNQIHAAVTALVESGVEPNAITSLADLVSPKNVTRILRQRYKTADGRANAFNRDIARFLVQIAREWVKVDRGVLAELMRLAGKISVPMSGLTDKNKRSLRQFDDPAVLQRLFNLPEHLWREVRNGKPNQYTLAKAQAALAVAILSYMPLRLQNLATLTFDVHLFLREGPRSISTLELPASEVKNRRELAFDIPSHVAKMLIEYRNRIAPKVIGHRPDRLFVNANGTPKVHGTVALLITTCLRKRAGLELTAHQFRHLCAKILLDAEPGSFETVRQLLGHKSLSTAVLFYAGIDSRRAARHHRHLVEKTLAADKPME
jgi:integrase